MANLLHTMRQLYVIWFQMRHKSLVPTYEYAYFIIITRMQCATSNHAMRHFWRMRHRLATPALTYL